ncbi:MAG TPA: diguanylate cyclase, partial [Thermoplasmata archaeon]|nr:diguanylate cyclase [Thermoplasmata archaeon]
MVSLVKKLQTNNKSVVYTLYSFSKSSLIVLILLSTAIMLSLYPLLHQLILLWYLPLVALVLYRLYDAYLIEKKPKTYTKAIWYKKFIILAYITGILYASIGFIYIHFVDIYYQLFILSVVVGFSSGAAFSLSPDIRLSINYISILMLPLTITLFLMPNMPLNYILSVSLLLYYVAQISIIYRLHMQNKEIRNLESSHTLLDNFFKNAPLALLIYNKDLIVTDCNEKLTTIFHNDKKNIIGLDLSKLPDSRPLTVFENAFKNGSDSYTGPYSSMFGEDFHMELKTFSYKGSIDEHTVGIAVIENKTNEYQALEKLEYMVDHDILTGLLNRRGFKNYMDHVIVDPKHETYYSILFYLDLNQFKSINDSLGHAAGDKVLISVSERLLQKLGDTCKISRVGGDEFN